MNERLPKQTLSTCFLTVSTPCGNPKNRLKATQPDVATVALNSYVNWLYTQHHLKKIVLFQFKKKKEKIKKKRKNEKKKTSKIR